MISTESPLASWRDSGAIRPFTFAPAQWSPTSVCTEKAKSMGEDPTGNCLTSPFGVKTKISPWKRSMRRNSMNSSGSLASFCHSRT